jgi:hypothetical protein
MEHDRVPVRVAEEGHETDAGVEWLAGELDTPRLELLLRLLDIADAQGDRRSVRPLELLADVRRVEQVEADVLAELELRPGAVTICSSPSVSR